MNLKYPVYFSTGLTEKVKLYTKLSYFDAGVGVFVTGQPLLQAVYHMDQSKDPKHFRPEEHV